MVFTRQDGAIVFDSVYRTQFEAVHRVCLLRSRGEYSAFCKAFFDEPKKPSEKPVAKIVSKPEFRRGDIVRASASTAAVLRGWSKIATLPKHQTVTVQATQGPWIGITLRSGGKTIGGWVWRNQLQRAAHNEAHPDLSRSPRTESRLGIRDSLRTWTDSSGKHQARAVFLGCSDGIVHFQKENGKRASAALTNLSEGDRNHIAMLVSGLSLVE